VPKNIVIEGDAVSLDRVPSCSSTIKPKSKKSRIEEEDEVDTSTYLCERFKAVQYSSKEEVYSVIKNKHVKDAILFNHIKITPIGVVLHPSNDYSSESVRKESIGIKRALDYFCDNL
jgi:hypothetical protein